MAGIVAANLSWEKMYNAAITTQILALLHHSNFADNAKKPECTFQVDSDMDMHMVYASVTVL